ncbi:MAG: SocA family protein [Ignavibacteria bacterium]|nr:SocA family protein [Ignavibacteria bacterium]
MFREILNDKIGNIFLILSKRIPELNLTKALKLLFLIDEASVQRTGVPITWLDYKVWKLGPVPEEIYNEIKKDIVETVNLKPLSIKEYVKWSKINNPVEPDKDAFLIQPIEDAKEVNTNIFSDYELELISEVIDTYGSKSAKELIHITHKEGSLWKEIVDANNLEKYFEIFSNTSPYNIDFVKLIKDDDLKLTNLKNSNETLLFQSSLQK